MSKQQNASLTQSLASAKAHPWHGVEIGPNSPHVVSAYIEMVPTDTVKYEIDKVSGHLKIDRPQTYSNFCPTLYGFLPQTYSGKRVGERCSQQTKRSHIKGDEDPIDICVLTERPVTHGDILVTAIPIGGLRLIDHGEADDKLIAVLENDSLYGGWKEISDCSPKLLERLKHYFLTYKQIPSSNTTPKVEIAEVYGADEARTIIELSREDYRDTFAP